MWRAHEEFSPNVNVHPAFGNSAKIERNRELTASVMKLNYGMQTVRTGRKPIETTNDPLKRKPDIILTNARIEASIFGRFRARIAPRAPQQVLWKNPYWVAQRPPQMQVIGPFTQASLPQQSILMRMSSAFGNLKQS